MQNSDYQATAARALDALELCKQREIPKFVGFLDAESAVVALNAIKNKTTKFMLWSGYEDGERAYLGVFPDWSEPNGNLFPITPIEFSYRICDRPTHKDFLGALMALGLERKTVGDILVGTGRTIAFVSETVAEFVLSQIIKIGSVGVSTFVSDCKNLPGRGEMQDFADTVASLRLDCIVASLAKCSRTIACKLIQDGMVNINGLPSMKPTVNVHNGDKISIRKKGKFILDESDSHSKKGRIILKYKKYV